MAGVGLAAWPFRLSGISVTDISPPDVYPFLTLLQPWNLRNM